jgi:hypothetical protein
MNSDDDYNVSWLKNFTPWPCILTILSHALLRALYVVLGGLVCAEKNVLSVCARQVSVAESPSLGKG